MKLRPPGPTYDRQQEADRIRQIEQADRENHKRGKDLEVGNARLIVRDTATGARVSIRVTNGAIFFDPV